MAAPGPGHAHARRTDRTCPLGRCTSVQPEHAVRQRRCVAIGAAPVSRGQAVAFAGHVRGGRAGRIMKTSTQRSRFAALRAAEELATCSDAELWSLLTHAYEVLLLAGDRVAEAGRYCNELVIVME